MARTADEWYVETGCDHAHCPNNCGEHPGPIFHGGRLLCGRCAVLYGEVVDMVPCRPETCE